MGLNFGCIDLIVRPTGDYVFLECNPNGQWLWIELATGQKISASIAEWLINAETR
jgi:glutathione synthase/RimK-type ligase-like ATP-grasp enzyme